MLLVVAVLALAGCGGSSKDSTSTPAVPDPAQALRELITAAHDGDEAALRPLLTRGSKVSVSELEERLGMSAGKPTRLVYRGGDWAVASVRAVRTVGGTRKRSAYAVAFHLVDGRWRADLSRKVRVRILGPDAAATAAAIPQLAAEVSANGPLAETGLWIDGKPLEVKGGGTPTRGTIYGAPKEALAAGQHAAIAYGRTARSGTAVAWLFRVG